MHQFYLKKHKKGLENKVKKRQKVAFRNYYKKDVLSEKPYYSEQTNKF